MRGLPTHLSFVFLLITSTAITLVHSKTDARDVSALNVMFSSLSSPSQLAGWKSSGGDPCGQSWKGIKCSGSSVTEIDMSKNNLKGDIPYQLPPNARHMTGGNSWSSGPAPPPPPGQKITPRASKHSSKGTEKSGLGGAAIAGIVLGVLVALGMIIALLTRKRSSPASHYLEEDRLSQRRPFTPLASQELSSDRRTEMHKDFRAMMQWRQVVVIMGVWGKQLVDGGPGGGCNVVEMEVVLTQRGGGRDGGLELEMSWWCWWLPRWHARSANGIQVVVAVTGW
ncbi:hypothetical protein RJ639_010482 [Escallonia herrerae]|uniref:Leucine-rich repeat-containing N-terminal plant-type domain-containing protein n=1 Tax=Escallonia herrerae TaxID=1293975 RepID=A0AA89AP72_9ASTE|nr:hypothetical protein RJ639_010482 [Escallonia herrerae]